MKALLRSPKFQWLLGIAILALDQLSKQWARARFSLPDGSPDYFQSMRVIGEWLQFRLVFNNGAAFGMKPQSIAPFLSPTVFYALFSAGAMALLLLYYRKLGPKEPLSRLAIVLILAGAFGNLTDRLSFHKVTDFIDAGIPGMYPRWPTFNVADSSVCIGMILLLFMPLLVKKQTVAATEETGSSLPGSHGG